MRALLALLIAAACSHGPPAQPPADADAQKCSAVSDCTGMLPHLCRVCGDGGSECARWTCAAGACAMALCGQVAPEE
jgi:hypothetical protein